MQPAQHMALEHALQQRLDAAGSTGFIRIQGSWSTSIRALDGGGGMSASNATA